MVPSERSSMSTWIYSIALEVSREYVQTKGFETVYCVLVTRTLGRRWRVASQGFGIKPILFTESLCRVSFQAESWRKTILPVRIVFHHFSSALCIAPRFFLGSQKHSFDLAARQGNAPQLGTTATAS
jgi:hypothetical protein